MESLGEKSRIGCWIFLVILSLGLKAQVALQYLPCITCSPGAQAQTFHVLNTTDHIISDFGKRNCSGATDWHRGVDITLPGTEDYGFHLLSPVNGIITQLKRVGTYIYLVIDGPENLDFGYGHLFNSTSPPIQVGDLVLKQCNNSTSLAIINIAAGKALGPVAGATVTFNGITYTVTNHAVQGQVIAPLGNSATNASHLHLYHPADPALDPQGIANAKDPFEVIPHFNTAYDIFPAGFNNLAVDYDNIDYPGNITGSISVYCQMLNPGSLGLAPNQYYSSAVMDMDKVELFIRRQDDAEEPYSHWGGSNSAYTLVQGPVYRSYMSNGARTSSTIYPSIISQPGFGSPVQTGIMPFAYNEQPTDLYYFSDIKTRIHKNHVLGQPVIYANNNMDARYSDGKYQFFVRGTRVTGETFCSDVAVSQTIRIDNFRPFVMKVTARLENAVTPFSSDGWNWNNVNLTFSTTYNSACPAGNNIIVQITYSEPMNDASLTVCSWHSTIYTPVEGSHKKVWEFNVPASALPVGLVFLKIGGHDIADNPVEGFTNVGYISGNSFPVRQTSTSWSPQPYESLDIVHQIVVVETTPPVANFEPINPIVYQGDVVSFTDLSTGIISSWSWEFPGGTPGNSTSSNAMVQYPDPGVFPVSLTVSNTFGSSVKTGVVTVTTTQQVPVADFAPKDVVINLNTAVHFMDLSTGGPDQWYWDFDGVAPASVMADPTVMFDQAGVYTVVLVVQNTAGSDMVSGTITVSDGTNSLDVSCFVSPFLSSLGNPVSFQGAVFNGTPPYQYLFDFGDGTIIPVSSGFANESVSHAYNNSGTFNLAVTISDFSGQMVICPESVTIIGGSPCDDLLAAFSMSPGSGTFSAPANSAVCFTDASSGGTPPYLYNWTFGPDPLTAAQPSLPGGTTQGPYSVTYSQPGNYPVSLHICDQNGCGKTFSTNVTVFLPQHCLVTKINHLINGQLIVPLGISCFWDMTFVPWCGSCQDPPGTSNFPCETDNYWSICSLPSGNQLASKSGHPFQEPGCVINSAQDQSFVYNFVTPGTYSLTLKAWDNNCNVESGFDCKDQTSLKVRVIDCSALVEACSQSLDVNPGMNGNVYGGIIRSGGNNCPLTIPALAEIQFIANKEVTLSDGFRALASAEFRAAIEPCPSTLPCDKMNPEQAGIPEVGWEIYPNPGNDWVTVRFTDEQLKPYRIEVYNLLGECKLCLDNLVGKVRALSVNTLPPGIYLFKYSGENRSLLTKFIKN
ncbi:MAG: PKD domain-containing protein [Bacteroidetes bacterium]|nr:PKD domain-containing protein [Bacteroidota bacterium]